MALPLATLDSTAAMALLVHEFGDDVLHRLPARGSCVAAVQALARICAGDTI